MTTLNAAILTITAAQITLTVVKVTDAAERIPLFLLNFCPKRMSRLSSKMLSLSAPKPSINSQTKMIGTCSIHGQEFIS